MNAWKDNMRKMRRKTYFYTVTSLYFLREKGTKSNFGEKIYVCFDDDDATCGSNENVLSFKNAPLVDVIF